LFSDFTSHNLVLSEAGAKTLVFMNEFLLNIFLAFSGLLFILNARQSSTLLEAALCLQEVAEGVLYQI
jgi:hypothetical protein